MTHHSPRSLWGPWLDELMAWFNNPAPQFCPRCGLFLVPKIFRRTDGEYQPAAREESNGEKS